MKDATVAPDRFVTAPPDPSGALVTAVGYETVREASVDHRGLPSPFLTFIVTLDEPVVIAGRGGDRKLDVVVAGLTTEAEIVRMSRRQAGLQAAVHPLAARRLFRMPAAELARASIEGEDVLGRLAPRLRERLAETDDWDQRFAIFAAEIGLDRGGRPAAPEARPEVVEAWRLLAATRGQIRIEELAERVFLSRRRLSTLFAAELGLTPKEAARTMRFTHATARIGKALREIGPGANGAERTGPLDLARLAVDCGYADQSHLDREFRAFAGTSPTGWIAEELPNIQAGGHRYAQEWEA